MAKSHCVISFLVSLLLAPSILLSESLGTIPHQCGVVDGKYEWQVNEVCLVQSWALKFKIEPKVLKPRNRLTVTVNSLFDGAVTWKWEEIRDNKGEKIGKPIGSCDTPSLAKGEIARCTFRVGKRPTKGWRTAALPFNTSFGQYAFSRDYYGIVKKGLKKSSVIKVQFDKRVGQLKPNGDLYAYSGSTLKVCNRFHAERDVLLVGTDPNAEATTLQTNECVEYSLTNDGEDPLLVSLHNTNKVKSKVVNIYILPDGDE